MSKTRKKSNDNELEKRLEGFREILEGIPDLDDKRRVLWLEIYDNAINDRAVANMLLNEAVLAMNTSQSHEHLAMGTTLTKYLERMGKSNEQLLKLAEMILKIEERKQESLDAETLLDQLTREG